MELISIIYVIYKIHVHQKYLNCDIRILMAEAGISDSDK